MKQSFYKILPIFLNKQKITAQFVLYAEQRYRNDGGVGKHIV
jgi:hypothetical protein